MPFSPPPVTFCTPAFSFCFVLQPAPIHSPAFIPTPRRRRPALCTCALCADFDFSKFPVFVPISLQHHTTTHPLSMIITTHCLSTYWAWGPSPICLFHACVHEFFELGHVLPIRPSVNLIAGIAIESIHQPEGHGFPSMSLIHCPYSISLSISVLVKINSKTTILRHFTWRTAVSPVLGKHSSLPRDDH